MKRNLSIRIILISVFLTFLFAFVLQSNLNAQSITVAGREYQFIDGKWYNMINGYRGDEIIPSRLVVRLEDRGNINKFDFNSFGIGNINSIGRRFLDGFYVLSIQDT